MRDGYLRCQCKEPLDFSLKRWAFLKIRFFPDFNSLVVPQFLKPPRHGPLVL